MVRRIECDLKQLHTQKRRLERSLPGFVYRSLAVFVSVLFLSEPVAATPGRYPVKMAQQPEASLQNAKRAAAERSFAEGWQLYKQGTAESLRQAIGKLKEALPLWRAVGERAGEAITLTGIGRVYNALGEKQQALKYYNQALPLWRAVGERAGEGTTLNNIGTVYSDLGEKQQALKYYNQSLPLMRAVGNRALEATTLNNIGTVYNALGEKQQALKYYNQSLPLSRAVGDKAGEATTLNNIGRVYDDLGEKQQALKYYNQSLPLSRAVGDKAGEATTLNNIGLVYSDLGEKQQALNYFNQALPLWRAVGERAGEARTLNNIGLVYSDLGEKQQALNYYNQALPLRRAVSDKAGEATTLNNIGTVYYALGEKQQALNYFNQSLPLSRAVGDKAGEASTLNNIGKVYSNLGEKQQALNYYNQALPLRRAVGDKAGEAVTLSNIAYFERNQGHLNEALTQIEASLKILESLRTKVINQELRTSYFASVQDYYKFYIDLLMQLHKQQPAKGYDALALQASERASARSLLELLNEAHADIRTGVEPKLLEQERKLLSQLDAMEKRRIQLLGGNHTASQAAALEKDNSALLAQYQEVSTQIRVKSPRYAELKSPQPLTLAEIQQQVLDNNTLLVEYSLGEEHSYLWAVTKTGITSYELPKRADFEAAAQRFRDALTTPSQRTSPHQVALAAVPLSQMLLGPVAHQLGQKRLLIVSDGALQYVPFAALPIPTKTKASPTASLTPLLVEHEIVSLPSASTLAVLRHNINGRQPAPKTVAVFADPIFAKDDERVKQSVASAAQHPGIRSATPNMTLELQALQRSATESDVTFNRLPGTRQEAEQILKLVPANTRFQAFDFAANLTQATNPNLAQYKIVHFATHSILNSVNPQLSGVVLSLVDENGAPENGFLRLPEIFNLNLPAELVVLSACQTALGRDVKGEGLVGLTRGFMYAGAPRVVVSLWNVDDRATALLMTKFYQGMLQLGLKPAAALRAAQIAMWKQQQWQAPYYWAAFVLQGEWK